MSIYAKDSGIAITVARVTNFRSLSNIEVTLSDLTVLIGANNAGKTSFLDAMFAAVGAGRKVLGADDVRIAPGEATPPKDREVLIDLKIRPIGDDGKVVEKYPEGSFWTSLWGSLGIAIDETEFYEFTPIRTTLKWSEFKGEYLVERKFMKEWKAFADWTTAQTHDKAISSTQIEPVALHYVDAKRDLEDDLKRPGSFWRRMTDDLGLSGADVAALENSLSAINQEIVDKSSILKHLKDNLSDIQTVVSADSAGIDISPVARKLRDLSKGVDVSFSTTGAQSFPLARHGMGTRSLASLLVFRAYASWRHQQATKGGDKVHSILALEEPESHLHPQAQRSLFAHIKNIPGQRIVSTHSPYFAGQAQLADLRLFMKSGGDTTCRKLDLSALPDDNDRRKLQETVIDSRGDILFAQAVVLFEGQTEEQALPIWAKKYWGATIHELGFCFVRVNGTDYFPFIWLAKALGIPWYVFGDGEKEALRDLESCLEKADEQTSDKCANVFVMPGGNNFETQLFSEGYAAEIKLAFNAMTGSKTALDDFIAAMHGQKAKKGVLRDYQSAGGRGRAMIDFMSASKTSLSKHLAQIISELKAPARRFPSKINALLEAMSAAHQLEKAKDAA